MKLCDLTLSTPEENLALDEALLDLCESGVEGEILRFWEPTTHFVVVGYANRVRDEVNVPFCEASGIPIIRRCTGGGTVLQGPGCLNYALVLRIADSPSLRTIAGTNNFILQRHKAALSELVQAPVEIEGHTDLAVGGLKFSGNSQRRRKEFLLFHGCFLRNLDIGLIENTLRFPSKPPDYRVNRSHSEFLRNLNIPAEKVKAALIQAWNASAPLPAVPGDRVERLVREKYADSGWNFRF